jgi:hypothetical protein
MVASGLAAGLLSGACFDFDATMAGGSTGDSGGGTGDASMADGPYADGSIDGGVDAAVEAGADGSVGTGDAAPHEGGSAPEAGGPYCASLTQPEGGLFFCDDFDEHALPGSWQTWAETNGTIVETDASFVSPPNSVDETTVPVSSGQIINVALRTPMPVPAVPTTLRLGFSLQPLRIDTTANAAIVLGAIDFLDNAGYRYTVGLAINVASGLPALALGEQSGLADGDNFPDGAPPTFVNHPLSPSMPLAMNAWSDLVIEVDWGTSSLEGKVIVNGNLELDVPLTLTVDPTSLQIGVGTSFVTEYATGLSPVWELRYDNVLFTAQ